MRHPFYPWFLGSAQALAGCFAGCLIACNAAAEPLGTLRAAPAATTSTAKPAAPAALPSATNLSRIGIAAVVNDEVISKMDVVERARLIASTSGMPASPEALQQLAPKVMRMLIDEKLQLQEAKSLGIRTDDGAVKDAVAALEKQAGKAPGSLEADIKASGASLASLYGQLRAQSAWSQIMAQKIRPRIKISNEEAQREAQRLQAGGGLGREANLTVLTLPISNGAQEPKVKALSKKLAEQISKGVAFDALVSQLEAKGLPAPTDNVWVPLGELDPALAAPLKNAKEQQVVGPVRTRIGYQLVRVNRFRAGETADEATPVEVLLKQILFALPRDAANDEVQATLASAREVQKNPGTCSDETVAGVDNPKDMNLEVSYLRTLLSRLPKAVQPLVHDLDVGTVSEPFATLDGIEMLVLCERIEQPSETPSVDETVKNKLFREKMEREAMKYLRDLRRTAAIDVRM
jgi:peptidyl-prolyl cis-trans isomerase SurA